MGAGLGAAAGATAGLLACCSRAAPTPFLPKAPPWRWYWTVRWTSPWPTSTSETRCRAQILAMDRVRNPAASCRARGLGRFFDHPLSTRDLASHPGLVPLDFDAASLFPGHSRVPTIESSWNLPISKLTLTVVVLTAAALIVLFDYRRKQRRHSRNGQNRQCRAPRASGLTLFESLTARVFSGEETGSRTSTRAAGGDNDCSAPTASKHHSAAARSETRDRSNDRVHRARPPAPITRRVHYRPSPLMRRFGNAWCQHAQARFIDVGRRGIAMLETARSIRLRRLTLPLAPWMRVIKCWTARTTAMPGHVAHGHDPAASAGTAARRRRTFQRPGGFHRRQRKRQQHVAQPGPDAIGRQLHRADCCGKKISPAAPTMTNSSWCAVANRARNRSAA